MIKENTWLMLLWCNDRREKVIYFWHVLALWPGFLQMPKWRFGWELTEDSGTESSLSLVAASGFRLGVPERETGVGTAGRGHVGSLSGSGQKVCICSYRYHSLSCDNPFGKICCGTVNGGRTQSFFRSEILIFLELQRSWTWTTSGQEESKWKWW